MAALIFIIVNITACNSKDSETVVTEDIFMTVFIDVDESENARIRISLKENNALGAPLVLTGEDSIILEFNDEEIPLNKDTDFLDIDYEGSVDTQGQEGAFILRFMRSDEITVEEVATLGKGFDITGPSSGSTFSEEDALVEVTWSNTQQQVDMELHGTLACTTIDDELDLDIDHENETWTVADTGQANIRLFELIFNIILEVTIEDEEIVSFEPCELSFTLTRIDSQKLFGLEDSSVMRIRQIRSSPTYDVRGIDSN